MSFAEYMTIYGYTNNLIEKYPKQSKHVYDDSQHRYAPTHIENAHFKILHARIHDSSGSNRSHCKPKMYGSLCIIRLSIVYRVSLIL